MRWLELRLRELRHQQRRYKAKLDHFRLSAAPAVGVGVAASVGGVGVTDPLGEGHMAVQGNPSNAPVRPNDVNKKQGLYLTEC
jgi:hypothetical protein